MPLIADIGRREPKGRFLVGMIYLILILGALTMVYPFALMVASSFTGRMDYAQFRLVPMAFRGEDEGFVAFLGDRYEDADWPVFEAAYRDPKASFWTDVASNPREFVARNFLHDQDPEKMKKYEEFLAALPVEEVGFLHHLRAQAKWDREVFFPATQKLPPVIIAREYAEWLPNEPFHQYSWRQPATVAYQRILDFRSQWPARDRKVITGRQLWLQWLRSKLSTQDRVSLAASGYETDLDVPFLHKPLKARFIKEGIPARLQFDDLPEVRYARYLGVDDEWVDLPVAEFDRWLYDGNRGFWITESLLSNYREVWEFLTTKGRALPNTVILVVLSIFSALVINPLAAYALSRFRMKAAPSFLLFFLATSAFPAEVAMIPNFLLLRDLGLLNTFGALILPGAANGFSIFILKAFFDSLPRELYEAVELDGGGELIKFWHVTMRLSTPILAVTALGAFTAAFTGFMWAFLVCQDERLWTLMVWLFQFQQTNAARPWLGAAALVIASIPTLLVFIFCQRIILRGIILPSWK